MNGTGICEYTTREGEKWLVNECWPHPEIPGVWFGHRHTDGRRVRVHEHRLRWITAAEITPATPGTQ